MDSISVKEQRLKFFKHKIKEQLLQIKNDIGDMRYKLYVTIVEMCDDYDELRDMAELEMQISMIEYTRREIKSKLSANNTDIKELRLVRDENYKNQIAQEMIEGAEETASKQEMDIAESLQDEEVSTAMALILMQRLATEPLEETYRDEIGVAFDKKPELSDLDLIEDSDFSDSYTNEENSTEEEDIAVDIDEAELVGDDTDQDEEFEIDEDALIGENPTPTVDTENAKEDKENSEMTEEDVFGTNDENESEEGIIEDIEVNEDDLFDDDEGGDDGSDEFEIDEEDIFGGDENDNTEFDVDEADLLGEDDDNETNTGNTGEIEVDESDLFGADEDDQEEKPSEEIEFDISEDDVFVEEDESDGIDDIEVDEDAYGESTDDEDDMFGEIDSSDLGEDNLLEDDLEEYNQNKTVTPDKQTMHDNKKVVKPTITPQTTFENGTERGEKSQQMFNWIHNTINKTEKVVGQTTVKTHQVVSGKIKEASKSSMFKPSGDEFIDF